MKKIRYNHRTVNVTQEGIQYIDENGNRQIIDFETCRKNWVEYVNNSEDFAVSNLSISETSCVAWRDITHKPPYIEFFTEPRIRFEFKFSLWCLSPKQAFIRVQMKIVESGWTTYDLS
jgi:hypothetical protein